MERNKNELYCLYLKTYINVKLGLKVDTGIYSEREELQAIALAVFHANKTTNFVGFDDFP